MKERAGHLPKEISVMEGLALLLEESTEVLVVVRNIKEKPETFLNVASR